MVDPRVARTRQSLQEALLDLARDHALDEITVADLTERAGVNRSSFYQHYSDKETLLADALDAVLDDLGARLATMAPGPITQAVPPQALTDYLTHLDANAALYRRVLGDQGSAVVAARVRARVRSVAQAALAHASADRTSEPPVDVLAAGLTGLALGVVQAWLEREPRPPVATAVDWVWRLLLGPAGAGY